MSSSKYPDQPLPTYKSVFRADALEGKYAFITGGGSGINFRIAEAYMAHGCNVTIASRTLERVKVAAQRLSARYPTVQCLYYSMDVSKAEQVIATIHKVMREWPRIDIVINGAAGNFLCAAEDMSMNGFKRVLEIDTMGAFNVTKACFDSSLKKYGGVVISITATLGHNGAPNQAHAAAAKSAIEAMTRSLANEWGEYNIRVNCIAPGWISGTLGFEKLGGKFVTSEFEHTTRQRVIPLGRSGEKRNIADAALFLASDAGNYVTGQTMVVDGGEWMRGGFSYLAQYVKENPLLKKAMKAERRGSQKSKL